MKKLKKIITAASIAAISGIVVAEAKTDVAGMTKNIYNDTFQQVKSVVNDVVLPIVIGVLIVLFIVKTATVYNEYRKSGHLEWTAPALLFVGLCVAVVAKTYMWSVMPASTPVV